MELKHLSNFVVLAEELNFRRAAERLHMTQPPLSRQVAAMEEELGVLLLNRDNRHGVTLTPEGQILLIEARHLLRQMDRTLRMLQQRTSPVNAMLRLGFVASCTRHSLPFLLHTARRRNPMLSFELHEMNTQDQLNGLRRGALDVALVRGPVSCPGVESQTLWEEDFVLALPEGIVDDGMSPPPEALDGYTYVQFHPSIEPAVSWQTDIRAREAGLTLEPLQTVTTRAALVSMVSAGLGVSLIPAALSADRQPGVTYHPVAGSTGSEIYVAWHSGEANEAVASFLTVALECAPVLREINTD